MAAMRCLVLLLWAGVTAASQVDLHKRIYGGRDCLPNDRPHHVHLDITTQDGPFFCGGTLISDQWVLTAAHCYGPGWKITAVLGKLKKPIKELPITDHHIYKDTNGKEHDIMLLKLPQSFPSTKVPHAVLPKDCKGHPKKGAKVTVAGHSRTKSKPGEKKVNLPLDRTKPLRCADFKVTACGSCIINSRFLYTKTFCYEDLGKDTTPGDSGGGVIHGGRLYGVHVAGGKKLCSTTATAMKVCDVDLINWIKEKIQKPSPKSAG